MKKNLLAITGVFMPYNGTMTQITYKHLCNLDYNIDVVVLQGKKDPSMEEILRNDKKYEKFNFHYVNEDWRKIYLDKTNLNIFKIIKLFRLYYKKCKSVSKTKKYDVLYSCSMPNFTHFPAYLIKKRLGNKIKWYASFTDPIMENPYIEQYKKCKFFSLERVLYYIEKYFYYKKKYQTLTLKYADKLIFISEELRDFITKGEKELLKKSIIIPLTYVEQWPIYNDLINYTPNFNNKKVKFMHFGNIYGLRKIDAFLEALLKIKEENSDLLKYIEFYQYGDISSRQLQLIKEYNLENIFKVHSKINYKDCVNLMKSEADVLIIFDTILKDSETQPFLPSKILDYLLIRKPIFSITTKNSPLYNILKKNHICVSYNAEEIKKAILNQIENIEVKNNNYEKYENNKVIESTLGKSLDIDI